MTAQSPRRAFTLIELLVVIAIITILMGLLFPVVGSVKEQMRKTQAKNDLMQLVNAVKAYNVEYGRYPIPTVGGTNDVSFVGPDNGPIIDILRYSNVATSGSFNPRAIQFLDVPAVKDAAAPKSGVTGTTTTTGIWYDPWGNAYNLAMDANYDNQITGLTSFYTDFPTISTGVIAWSYGKDKKPGANGDNKFNNGASDDVISWQ